MMKKIQYQLAAAASALMLLTACADAELDTFPQVKVTLEATLVDGCPHYAAKVETTEEIAMGPVHVVQQYYDHNSRFGDKVETDIFEIKTPTDGTYTASDQTKHAYAGDVFRAIAVVTTEIGSYESEELILTLPGDGVPKVKAAWFTFDTPRGKNGTLRIYGEEFTTKPYQLQVNSLGWAYDLFSAEMKCYSDSIILTNIVCNKYGTATMELVQYGKRYTFEATCDGVQVASITPSSPRLGEVLTLNLANASSDTEYSVGWGNTKDRNLMLKLLERKGDNLLVLPYHLHPNDNTTWSNLIEVNDKTRGIPAWSDTITWTRQPWDRWQDITPRTCRVGNYIIWLDGNVFNGLEINTQQADIQKKAYAMGTEIADYRLFDGGGRFAYVWYMTSDNTCHVGRFDTELIAWEHLSELKHACTTAWMEDAHTLRTLCGPTLYTFHFDTGTWDEPIALHIDDNPLGMRLDDKCQFCGTYEGRVYFCLDGSIYRYPIGTPQSIELVGKPIVPLSTPYLIQNGNFYFAYSEYTVTDTYPWAHYYFYYIYKMPMQSLLDGKSDFEYIGCNEVASKARYPVSTFYETPKHCILTMDTKMYHLSK